MEAVEGGGINVAAISPSFPYKPTVGIVQWQKSRFLYPSAGGRNPPPPKKQSSGNCSTHTSNFSHCCRSPHWRQQTTATPVCGVALNNKRRAHITVRRACRCHPTLRRQGGRTPSSASAAPSILRGGEGGSSSSRRYPRYPYASSSSSYYTASG